MKNVALHNLGCKVNAYEMDYVQQILIEKGYNIVSFEEKADIYIVNTCTVTNIADRKSRQLLHRAKALNPQALVVALGCYIQTGREDALKDPCIDLAIGNNRKKDIVGILEEYLEGRERRIGESEAAGIADKTLRGSTVVDMGGIQEYEEMQLKKTAEHTRAYIKIQDGCNQFCSYCIIPYARGRVRSRRMEDVLEEVRGMAEAGYREVVLTGIHISSYGIDLADEGFRGDYRGQSRLAGLVEEIQQLSGINRIRLGSLEPRIVTEDFVARLAACDKVCPHFHLSLQSGSDSVLKRMNRHYTSGEYYHSVELLRRYFDHPAITTDVIVGFPGETEEEFQECRSFLEKVQFYEMHIFKYSRRRGTAADRMPGQLTDAVKTHRSAVLQQLEREQSRAFRSRYIGQEVEVLFEESREMPAGLCRIGHTADYVRVALPGEEELRGSLVKVKIKGFLTDEVMLADALQL
ncbi:MAG: tRNA (N(6)-L-threonylcarbamoyladenosine(37)-C(2))-methylthiotransferase MtaB [bacterium]|nr:tRNA (N(6)-L-threonylcarbamoyladenosine(37)-C(2))-methylthiotransferase MtaB [bacterium]MCM1375485.1 tRNA (N(6)-L-threonylcarbamoyladenosine(37)-C(2))-methylthiotransferase MtaB [Muribaculum sp.]